MCSWPVAHLVVAPPPAPIVEETTTLASTKKTALKPVNGNKPKSTSKRPPTRAPNARQQTKKAKKATTGKAVLEKIFRVHYCLAIPSQPCTIVD